jgi:integrase
LAHGYTHANKRKTLALGVYPSITLAEGRAARDKARKLLAKGIDPNVAKQEQKQATAAAANTFEIVAREWLAKTAADRMASTTTKVTTWLEKDMIPYIGTMPMSSIGPRDVTQDLKGALMTATPSHFAAITDPKQAGQLMRSIFAYTGHPCTVAALKLTPLVFVRPGELRTVEWAEIDLDAAEWRIPGGKMKMKNEVDPIIKTGLTVV